MLMQFQSDDGDVKIETEDDGASGSSGSSGTGSGTALQTTVQDPVCVGSTQCTSLWNRLSAQRVCRCAAVVEGRKMSCRWNNCQPAQSEVVETRLVSTTIRVSK
jgi:hypothetical protein